MINAYIEYRVRPLILLSSALPRHNADADGQSQRRGQGRRTTVELGDATIRRSITNE
jgi:hypothetical protein